MKTIRIGMIGSGYMAKLHSLAFRNLPALNWPETPRIELVRIADVNATLAEDAANRWGWSSSSDDWKAITRADDIDIVDVATPNGTHEEIVADAFAHGKHVLCEKPLSTDAETAARMLDAARASGKVHMVNFTYRNWPAIRQAKDVIESGRIGKIRYFEGHFFQDYNNDDQIPLSWRFLKKPAGAGAAGDIGSHILDLARYLVGDVKRLTGMTRTFIPERPLPGKPDQKGRVEVDDLMMTMMEFDNGATGTVHASWALPGFKNDVFFTVVGDRGALRFSWERSNELHFYSEEDPQDLNGYRQVLIGGIHPGADLFWFPKVSGSRGQGTPGQGLGYGETFVLNARQLITSVLRNESPSPNFEDGLRCCELIDAALKASETGTWVDVPRLR